MEFCLCTNSQHISNSKESMNLRTIAHRNDVWRTNRPLYDHHFQNPGHKFNDHAKLTIIPTEILKFNSDTLSQPISNLINMYLATGVFPDIFKLAKIISVFKDGDSSNNTDYRPLSPISILSKIFRKYMNVRLYSCLEKFEFLYKYQYGFFICSQLLIL